MEKQLIPKFLSSMKTLKNMNKSKFIILKLFTFFFGFIMSQNLSFSQSKKKQIEEMNFKIDSLNQVLTKERIDQKNTIISLEAQDSKSKQKVDSLTKEMLPIEKQIDSQQSTIQKKLTEIDKTRKSLTKHIDSLTQLKSQINDVESNIKSVKIGNQTWMTENLNVSTFRNGDPIPEAKTHDEWFSYEAKQPAWCYYDNDPANAAKYGKLYNWYAVNDSRGLAPVGYHIPSDAEWTKLADFLGGEIVAGTKMKSKSGWDSYTNEKEDLISGNGTNTSGFSGLPGGMRHNDGSFFNVGEDGYWWSSSEDDPDGAWGSRLSIFNGYELDRDIDPKGNGYSVRCLRD